MKVQGSYLFNADAESVWNALQSPEVLSSCIPGSEEFRPTGPDTYDVALRLRVAVVSGSYTGKVTIEDKVHPESYRMIVEGKGAAGSLRSEVSFKLSPEDGGTRVELSGDAQVSGVVARVGQRLMGSASRMLMNQFFGCLKSRVEGVSSPRREQPPGGE